MGVNKGFLYRSGYILPQSGPLILDGGLFISGGLINLVGRYVDVRREISGIQDLVIEELGDGVIYPGLINLHSHLEYSDMSGRVEPGSGFSQWASSMISRLVDRTVSDQAAAIQNGLSQLRRTSGCSLVVDHRTSMVMVPGEEVNVIRCREIGGVLMGIDPDWIWEQWMICLSGKSNGFGGPLVAPHSVYSVVPGLLKRLGKWIPSRHPSRCVSMHLSESREEFDYFASKSGAMWDWLTQSAKSAVEPLGSTPFEHLVNCGIPLRQVLIIHGNYLTDSELQALASEGGALVHCPRSHEFFDHDEHPVENWERHGISWGLGTDSLATVLSHPGEGRSDELDLLAEVRALKRAVPGLSWERLMSVVTSGAATILGVANTTGTLAAENRADFNFLPLPSGTLRESGQSEALCEAIFHSGGYGKTRHFIEGNEHVH